MKNWIDDKDNAAVKPRMDITERVEPGVIAYPQHQATAFLASIAISLKRIADSLHVIESQI
jgi:hypothetical protein